MFGILNKLFAKKENTSLVNILRDGAFLVDVRSQDEYKNGMIAGSINIPLDKIQDQINKFKNKNNIVVFCRSGNRSSQAKSILDKNGFSNVTNGGSWYEVKDIVDQIKK